MVRKVISNIKRPEDAGILRHPSLSVFVGRILSVGRLNIGVIWLILVMVLFVFPCCSQPPAEGKPGKEIVVRFWNAMGGPLGTILNSMIDEFNSDHPGWHIKSESMGNYETLKQKILASVVADNQPDMAQAYEAWISTLLGGDVLADLGELDPEFKQEELKDFFPVFIEDCLYDGKLYSLPFNKSVPVIYYNRDMFQRAGLDPYRPPRNWEEFSLTCQQLTRDLDGDGNPDQWGYEFTDHATYLECLIIQNRGELYDRNSSELLFNQPRGIEALQYIIDLVRKFRVADFYLGGYQHQVDFAAQKVGMIIASCASRTFMSRQLNFDWGIAPLPAHKKRASMVYGTNIVIFSDTSPEKKKVAWEFIKWFTSPENSARWALKANYVPVRISSLELPIMQSEFRKNLDSRVPIDELKYAFFEPRFDQWLRIRDYIANAVKEALLGKRTPAQALNKAAEKGGLWLY